MNAPVSATTNAVAGPPPTRNASPRISERIAVAQATVTRSRRASSPQASALTTRRAAVAASARDRVAHRLGAVDGPDPGEDDDGDECRPARDDPAGEPEPLLPQGPREQAEDGRGDGEGNRAPRRVADDEPLAAEERDRAERPHDRREIAMAGNAEHARREAEEDKRRHQQPPADPGRLEHVAGRRDEGDAGGGSGEREDAAARRDAGVAHATEEELEGEAGGEHAGRGGDQRPAAVRAVDLLDGELGHIEARGDCEHAADPGERRRDELDGATSRRDRHGKRHRRSRRRSWPRGDRCGTSGR